MRISSYPLEQNDERSFLKRFAGPFEKILFDNFIQLPAGLVQKSNNTNDVNNDTHLIFHLSWPKNDSLNFHTPKHLCSVKYKDMDNAVRMCLQASQGCRMAKTDIKSAFRNLSIRSEDWKMLVLMAKHPRSGKRYYFIDKILPFGLSISCSHFQRVSNGLEAIFFQQTGHRSNNYLDDFLFIAYLKNCATN